VFSYLKGLTEVDFHSAESIRTSVLEAASIILLCVQHQKRIIDDVLELSKLDAKLLVIAPEKVHPFSLLQKLLSIYDSELREHRIEARVSVDPSYADMAIEYAFLDPGRLLQVSGSPAYKEMNSG
jgi:signal transduction histidine kinase